MNMLLYAFPAGIYPDRFIAPFYLLSGCLSCLSFTVFSRGERRRTRGRLDVRSLRGFGGVRYSRGKNDFPSSPKSPVLGRYTVLGRGHEKKERRGRNVDSEISLDLLASTLHHPRRCPILLKRASLLSQWPSRSPCTSGNQLRLQHLARRFQARRAHLSSRPRPLTLTRYSHLSLARSGQRSPLPRLESTRRLSRRMRMRQRSVQPVVDTPEERGLDLSDVSVRSLPCSEQDPQACRGRVPSLFITAQRQSRRSLRRS